MTQLPFSSSSMTTMMSRQKKRGGGRLLLSSRNNRMWLVIVILMFIITWTNSWMVPPSLLLDGTMTPTPKMCRTLQTEKLRGMIPQNDDTKSKMVVIVVGLESSGSKLLTKIILNLAFPNHGKISGHGTYGHCGPNNSPADCFGVMHLSLPYFDCFPDPIAERAALHARGYQTRIVIATRDQSMSLRSKLVDHQRDMTAARAEQQIATKMLASLIASSSSSATTTTTTTTATTTTTNSDADQYKHNKNDNDDDDNDPFIFSYETLMLLKGPYVKRVAQYLDMTLPTTTTGNSNANNDSKDTLLEDLGLNLKDGNPKWMTFKAAVWSFLVRVVRFLGFGSRDPAIV